MCYVVGKISAHKDVRVIKEDQMTELGRDHTAEPPMSVSPVVGASPSIKRHGVASEADWRTIPEIRAEIADLVRRHTSDSLSIAEALCDRHPADAVAFFGVDPSLAVTNLTYGELGERSRRLASVLRRRGVRAGTRVGVLMGKNLQLPVVLLALWRLGAVHVPLFTAFAGPAIALRLEGAGATLVIADADQCSKVADVGVDVLPTGPSLDAQILEAPELTDSVAVGSDGAFIEIYTSGTTGRPKGVAVPGFALAAFTAYMTYGLDVRSEDMFWNAADPGWAYGLYYGIVGPMALGASNILLNAGFSTESTAQVLERLGVTNFAASPTVYRALKRDGLALEQMLRVASSAGEPLTADVSTWSANALGATVRDHWGQTEHGMAIVTAWDPRLGTEAVPGSMGIAMPGFVAGIVGECIALSVSQSPLMWFRGYVDAPIKTGERFTPDGEWYLSGDVGREIGGRFYFAARDDDVILAAGYRISPFDIESIIVTDDAVAEAAVVGRPDEIRGEVVEAFVVINEDAKADGLEGRLQTAVRNHYGAHAYPRRVHVVARLPKTPSGKVQRYILRKLGVDTVRPDDA